MKKVLFLCTGNSARSQIAEGLVGRDFAGIIETFSAGTDPQGLNPNSVRVMEEVGIDIGSNRSKHVSEFQGQEFDYVITLCDDANENCPVFFGGVTRLHMGFPDPAGSSGTPEEILNRFRLIRDEIRNHMGAFFLNELRDKPAAGVSDDKRATEEHHSPADED